ncbi:MAG: hypothetical protein AAGE18_04240 [Pseudomonadota bacterium]
MKSTVLAGFALLFASVAGAAELPADIALANGSTLTLRTATIWQEDLGRRVILSVQADRPEPAAGRSRQEADLRALCAQLAEVYPYLEAPPGRTPTHLELLFRDPSRSFTVRGVDAGGLRIDIRRSRCDR